MNSQLTHDHYQIKKTAPQLRAGDRVRVHQKIKEGAKERIQVFEGLVIKTNHGRGINGTFTVRRISLGVGVEKTFPLHLPSIVKIEKVRSAKVRRAKLFYVRDLIGKRANRLKKEKEDKETWEDVIVVEDDEAQNSNVKSQSEEEDDQNTEDRIEGKNTEDGIPNTEDTKKEKNTEEEIEGKNTEDRIENTDDKESGEKEKKTKS